MSAIDEAEARLGLVQQKEGYSNCDHVLDDGAEEKLRQGKTYMDHSAWNFAGYIWFEDGKFHEEVWRYNEPVEVLHNEDLMDLINSVNEKYGRE